MWLTPSHPLVPPMVYVKPTSGMMIKPGKYVDSNGKVYHEYLHSWNHVSDFQILHFILNERVTIAKLNILFHFIFILAAEFKPAWCGTLSCARVWRSSSSISDKTKRYNNYSMRPRRKTYQACSRRNQRHSPQSRRYVSILHFVDPMLPTIGYA